MDEDVGAADLGEQVGARDARRGGPASSAPTARSFSSGRSSSAIWSASARSSRPSIAVDLVVADAEPALAAARASRLDIDSETSSRTTSPKRRRRSSTCTASSRSSASSESSKSASRVTRKSARSWISMPGEQPGEEVRDHGLERQQQPALRRSAGSAAGPRAPSRGRTAPRRSRGCARSTPRLSESGEMYGNGWPGPTPSGVSTGKISRSNAALELGELLRRQIVDGARARMPAVGERRDELPPPDPRLPCVQLVHARADRRERLLRREPVGRANGDAARRPGPSGRRRAPGRTRPGSTRRTCTSARARAAARLGICRQLEDARVVVEPRELAVEQASGGASILGRRSRGHPSIIGAIVVKRWRRLGERERRSPTRLGLRRPSRRRRGRREASPRALRPPTDPRSPA